MRACIVKLEKLFSLSTTAEDGQILFHTDKRKLLIPLYQREYIWTEEKVTGLINDIYRRDKFIGNLILDEKDDCYDIVDGQQRITTCFLTLVCIYNAYAGQLREQRSLKNLLKPVNNAFSLENKSVGEYLMEDGERIKLSIQEENDVFFQKDTFQRTFNIIQEYICSLGVQANVKDFRDKLLNSKVLVLINDNDPITRSIEQIFLDINEKAALLEPEDIFKGYCFKNTDSVDHADLREKWVKIRKCGCGYVQIGFEDLSDYLYVFLLTTLDKEINQKLYLKGRHVLDGKSADETFSMLDTMINFGESVLEFISDLKRRDYRFTDVCQDAQRFRDTDDHVALKAMCEQHLELKGPQYYKIPMMCLIYALKHIDGTKNVITYDKLRRMVTNLYVYGVLFILSGDRKSKGNIDTTLWTALNQDGSIVNDAYNASKQLRNEKLKEFTLSGRLSSFDKLSMVYSIMDSFDSQHGYIRHMYTRENNYNIEHFIGIDNARAKMEWRCGENVRKIQLDVELVKELKHHTINYLIINEDLNGSMRSYDIVTKIEMLREWFVNRNQELPMHISVIIGHVENLPTYQTLVNLKSQPTTDEEIKNAYCEFIAEYISDEPQMQLLNNLQNAFREAFRN